MNLATFFILSLNLPQCTSKLLRKPKKERKVDRKLKIPFLYKLDDTGFLMENYTVSKMEKIHSSMSNNSTTSSGSSFETFYSVGLLSNDNNDTDPRLCIPEQIPNEKSTCWQWNVEEVNYYGNEQKGCDNELCQKAVCDCDPYCCNVSWDLSCRGFQLTSNDNVDNFFTPGCSASILCCESSNAYPAPPLPNNPIPNRINDTILEEKSLSHNPYTCEKENWTPPNDSTCWQWNVVQNGTSPYPGHKGCDYKPCQDIVCACDPYCCDASWDLSCRGVQTSVTGNGDNYFNPGCSASILCCETDDAFPKPPLPAR